MCPQGLTIHTSGSRAIGYPNSTVLMKSVRTLSYKSAPCTFDALGSIHVGMDIVFREKEERDLLKEVLTGVKHDGPLAAALALSA